MNDIIEKQTGKRTKILRFPGGVSNTVSRKYASKIMSKLAKKLRNMGITIMTGMPRTVMEIVIQAWIL